MVICKTKEEELWSAFGFFGGGSAGKSSLSFGLARLLVERDGFIVNEGYSLKVIDDNFTLENGIVSSDDWGGDKTGKCCEFVECLESLGHSHIEARPQKQAFALGTLTAWFIICEDVPTPLIAKATRDDFIVNLLSSNPCHGKSGEHPTSPSQEEINSSSQIREKIRNSFASSWAYFIVKRRNTQSPKDGPMLDDLASKAYDLWHNTVSRHTASNDHKASVP